MSTPELVKVAPQGDAQYRLGYFINFLLSSEGCTAIAPVQEALEQQFPGAISSFEEGSAHITVMDWLTPLAEYGRDKDALFQEVGPQYIAAMDEVLQNQPPITVNFDRIEAYPAAIIIRGSDDGSFRRIREQFLSKIRLLDGTRTQEPSFIHSTICRFTDEIDFAAVQKAAAELKVNFTEHIPELWLTRETKLFMQGYDVIKKFDLVGAGK